MAMKYRMETVARQRGEHALLMWRDARRDGVITPSEQVALDAALEDWLMSDVAADETDRLAYAIKHGVVIGAYFDRMLDACQQAVDELPEAA